MDPRLLEHYNTELQYIRESAAEFAREFPKIAARLSLDNTEVVDPYVERLLEGFAFLTARVNLKLEAEHAQLAERLLEMVYPGLMAPIPSMAVVCFQKAAEAAAKPGPTLESGTRLLGPKTPFSAVQCVFKTTEALPIVPVAVSDAEYFLAAPELPLQALRAHGLKPAAGLRLRLTVTPGASLDGADQSSVRLFIDANEELAFEVYEAIHHQCLGFYVVERGRPVDATADWFDATHIGAVGDGENESVLPDHLKEFSGIRLMQEFFAFPARFLFAELNGVLDQMRRRSTQEVDVCLIFKKPQASFQGLLASHHFKTNCVPAINLFSRQADRVIVKGQQTDHLITVDRVAPVDYEIYDIESVTGYDDQNVAVEFRPYFSVDYHRASRHTGFFSATRTPRMPTEADRLRGPRTSYTGSDVSVQLVDQNDAPYPQRIRQLSARVRCTNRDLPILMSLRDGQSGFEVDTNEPIESVAVVAGPSRPHSALRKANAAWQYTDLLSSHYLSILNSSPERAAAALRSIIEIVARASHVEVEKLASGILSVQAEQVVRRIPRPGPIAFGRGVSITVQIDEMAFKGSSAALFGRILAQYFARQSAINSFTETTIRSASRGEIARFAPALGARKVL